MCGGYGGVYFGFVVQQYLGVYGVCGGVEYIGGVCVVVGMVLFVDVMVDDGFCYGGINWLVYFRLFFVEWYEWC